MIIIHYPKTFFDQMYVLIAINCHYGPWLIVMIMIIINHIIMIVIIIVIFLTLHGRWQSQQQSSVSYHYLV